MSSFFEFHQQVTRRASGRRRRAILPAPVEGAPESPSSLEPLSVTQLTTKVSRALSAALPGRLAVRGEVGNCRRAGASGHLYLTLKDATNCLDCVMWVDAAERLKFEPQTGMELIASGDIRVYGRKGNYQLYVDQLMPVGQGALELAFQRMCEKLRAEGLFDPARKKPVPAYPARIVLLTSGEAAGLQDVLKVFAAFPFLRLVLCPVPVQGDGAAERIAGAIDDLNRDAAALGGIDVIYLGRGGGSLEDLREFNEEALARAIARSRIPIVTGIGHEIDRTVTDFVADAMAHTPTAAAELLTARWKTAAQTVEACIGRGIRALRAMVGHSRHRLDGIERHELFRRPLHRVEAYRQFLDDRQRQLQMGALGHVRRLDRRLIELSRRLEPTRAGGLLASRRLRLGEIRQGLWIAAAALLRRRAVELNRAESHLLQRHPRHTLLLARQRLDALAAHLDRAIRDERSRCGDTVERMAVHLNAVNPQRVLQRGYSITTLARTGKILRSVTEVRPSDRLTTRLSDGAIESTVPSRRSSPPSGGLFD